SRHVSALRTVWMIHTASERSRMTVDELLHSAYNRAYLISHLPHPMQVVIPIAAPRRSTLRGVELCGAGPLFF
ncbi:MAG: hypothetical protein G01um1014106_379, partial [Parcubacteria group bacterium Gr01-1014_106]